LKNQSQDESKQQQQENDETKKQIEEDADRELLNMRIRHEQLLREQQVNFNFTYFFQLQPSIINHAVRETRCQQH
jgi:hypothetical protein